MLFNYIEWISIIANCWLTQPISKHSAHLHYYMPKCTHVHNTNHSILASREIQHRRKASIYCYVAFKWCHTWPHKVPWRRFVNSLPLILVLLISCQDQNSPKCRFREMYQLLAQGLLFHSVWGVNTSLL